MAQTAQDVMVRDPETVAPEAPLTEIAELMRDGDTGIIAVTEGDQLVGVVTDRDIVIRALAEGRDPERCSARDVASGRTITAAPGDDVRVVAQRMREANVHRLPVVEGTRVVGVVSIGDVSGERDGERHTL